MGYLPSLLPSRACPLRSVSPLKSVPPQELRTRSPNRAPGIALATLIGIQSAAEPRARHVSDDFQLHLLRSRILLNDLQTKLLERATRGRLVRCGEVRRPTSAMFRYQLFNTVLTLRDWFTLNLPQNRISRCVLKMRVR